MQKGELRFGLSSTIGGHLMPAGWVWRCEPGVRGGPCHRPHPLPMCPKAAPSASLLLPTCPRTGICKFANFEDYESCLFHSRILVNHRFDFPLQKKSCQKISSALVGIRRKMDPPALLPADEKMITVDSLQSISSSFSDGSNNANVDNDHDSSNKDGSSFASSPEPSSTLQTTRGYSRHFSPYRILGIVADGPFVDGPFVDEDPLLFIIILSLVSR